MQLNIFNLVLNQCDTVKRAVTKYVIFLLLHPTTKTFVVIFF